MPIAPRPRLRLGGPRREPPPPDSTDLTKTFPWCLRRGIDTRPQYLWGVLLAVRVARALGLPSVAAIELGVGEGEGLLSLERAALAATLLSDVDVDVAVYGFDAGEGMPDPVAETIPRFVHSTHPPIGFLSFDLG